MIHKHSATHLHYDLRIEISNTLKSWALRDFPPLKPNLQLLAIQVPDHPLWYRHFEGIIPEGHYGAGEVIIWDKGYYKNFTRDVNGKIIPIEECLNNGFMLIEFSGYKTKGGYILIRISKKQKWLILKLKDKFALKNRKPKNLNRSIKSNKTIEDLKNKK